MSKKKHYKNNQNNYVQTRKKYSSTFKYFFKVMGIAFIPILVIDVLLSYVLKGQHEWIIWVVSFVGLTIAGILGLMIEAKMIKQRAEEEQDKKNRSKGKAVVRQEDIDIFGE